MKTTYQIKALHKLLVLCAVCAYTHTLSGQDIDFSQPCPNTEFALPAVAADAAMTPVVINAVLPPGAVTMVILSVDFPLLLCSPCASPQTFNGLTVTVAGNTVTLDGTPDISLAGSEIIFTIQAQSNSNCQRTYTMEVTSIPMDLVLVLDRSGSMGSNTGAGVTRWDALSDAAVNFATMYQALGRDADRLSITYFESDLSPTSACCSGLIPFSPTIANTIDTDLNANSPGGSTAMGLGLKNGESKLSDNTRARSILVFTDGMQNQAPRVNENGQGYDDGTSIDGGNAAGGIKIATIGIGNPSADYNLTLQNLANKNRGSYNITDDGAAFTFKSGNATGDLSAGFTDQFVDLLSEFSPQIVDRNTVDVSTGPGPHSLLDFTLNGRTSKLLLELVFDKKFETPQLAQLLGRIIIQKDGSPVTGNVFPSFAGNFTNTILLTIDFDSPIIGGAPISTTDSQGNWTVQLGDVTDLKINSCKTTAIADDHLFNYRVSYDGNPRVNVALKLSADLDFVGAPITDGTVEALMLRPGEDLGDLLAKHPLNVDPSSQPEAGSPGEQKFNELWENDQAFRDALARSENSITLNHTGNGHYEGIFNGVTVAGIYRLVYRLQATHPKTGTYTRSKAENFYASFNDIDLKASAASSQIANGQLVMQIKPITPYGRLVGPAMGSAFTVDNAGVQILDVDDHQDGSYTLTFGGDISQPVTLGLLGQDVFTGKLGSIGGDSIIGKIQDWFEAIGLPPWSIWVFLLLILVVLWLIFRKKNP